MELTEKLIKSINLLIQEQVSLEAVFLKKHVSESSKDAVKDKLNAINGMLEIAQAEFGFNLCEGCGRICEREYEGYCWECENDHRSCEETDHELPHGSLDRVSEEEIECYFKMK